MKVYVLTEYSRHEGASPTIGTRAFFGITGALRALSDSLEEALDERGLTPDAARKEGLLKNSTTVTSAVMKITSDLTDQNDVGWKGVVEERELEGAPK